jgi:hypothetical protein
MSVRDRVIDKCLHPAPSGTGLAWDTDKALTNLLLFETFVADEFLLSLVVPGAVNAFGYDGVLSLLDTGALSFHAGKLNPANMTPAGPEDPEDTFAFLDEREWSPGIYRIANIPMVDQETALASLFMDWPDEAGLTKREKTKLADAVSAHLVTLPNNYGDVSTFQTCVEVGRDSSDLRRAVARFLRRGGQGRAVRPNDIELSVALEDLHPRTLRIESNLEKALGLSSKEAYAAVGEGLLAVFRLNARIETMKACDAIFGLRADESEFVNAKLDFLAREVFPEAQRERFHRVLTIFNLPELGPAIDDGRLKMEKFIELRESEECRQFRAWLRNLDDATSDEIKERVDSLRAKMGNALHRNEGKAARFIVVNAISLGVSVLPIVGPLVSIALGGLDEFVVDRVLPESGPVAFLSSRYPSIFEASKGMAS